MSIFDRILNNFSYSTKKNYSSFNSQIWSKINKEKKFKDIDQIKISNFRNNGLSRGFDNDYLGLNSLEHKENFLRYLEKNNLEFNKIKDLLPSQNIGNNLTAILYQGKFINSKTKDFVQKFNLINKHIFKSKNVESCVEIGGGYGELARMILSKKKLKYVLIDLPETNLLSSFYLIKNFPNKKIVLSYDLRNSPCLNEQIYSNNDIFIICPWDKIGEIKFDLFFNFHSFMEMTISSRKRYFQLVHNKLNSGGYFLQENRYCKLVGFEKNLLREYEYDQYWKKILYNPNPENKKLGIILTKRINKESKDILILREEIKTHSKYYEVPNLPVILILIYKFFKRLIISK